MPWTGRVRQAVAAAGQRRKPGPLMEGGDDASSVDIRRGSSPRTSDADTGSPQHFRPGRDTADVTKAAGKAQQAAQRSYYLQVFTARAQRQQSGRRRPPACSRESSSDTDIEKGCTTSTTTTTTVNCSSANSIDSCAIESRQLVEETERCLGGRGSLREKTGRVSARGTLRTGGTEADADCPADRSGNLADRIDEARQCCSAMRGDISKLSTRCDTLFSRLKTIRAYLASLPSKPNHMATDAATAVSPAVGVGQASCSKPSSVDTVTAVSPAVGVGQASCSKLSSSGVSRAALPCASVGLPPRPELKRDGHVVTASPRASLSIVERVEEELSLRLDQLTAYISSSDIPVNQTEGDKPASAHVHFAEAKEQKACAVTAVPVSFSSNPATESVRHRTGKDRKRLTGENSFLRSASVMLTPPVSDESSSPNEDQVNTGQTPETDVLKSEVTSWPGRSDLMPTTPVLLVQSFWSDCHTPPIQALTCLESFSDSERQHVSLPADRQFLESSAVMYTPSGSDLSSESDDRHSCPGVCHDPETSPVIELHGTVIAGHHRLHGSEDSLSFSDSCDSDWQDYFTEHFWSCISPPSYCKEADVFTDDHSNGGPVSNMNTGSCVERKGFDNDEESGTQFSICKPASGKNIESGVQRINAPSPTEPWRRSSTVSLKRSKGKDGTDMGPDLQMPCREPLTLVQKSLNVPREYRNNKQDENDGNVNSSLVCREYPESQKHLTDVSASQMFKSTAIKSDLPYKMKFNSKSENKSLNTGPPADSHETSERVKEVMNPGTMVSNHLHQERPFCKLSELPGTCSNAIPNITLTTVNKRSATETTPDMVTGTWTQNSSEGTRAPVADTGHGSAVKNQFPCNLNDPALMLESISEDTNGTSEAHDLKLQPPPDELRDCRAPCQWKHLQKRNRQWRSARHLQHLSMAPSGIECRSLSPSAGSVTGRSRDSRSAVLSYSALEGMSCGFNLLRQLHSQRYSPLSDVNNNLPSLVNIVLPQRSHSPTLDGETQETPGRDNLRVESDTTHYNCSSSETSPATENSVQQQSEAAVCSRHSVPIQQYVSGEDVSSVHQDRQRRIALDELKTRLYTVTKVRATQVGICMKRCTPAHSEQEKGEISTLKNAGYTTDVQGCSKIRVASSDRMKAQKPAVALNVDKHLTREKQAFSEVTYGVVDTRKEHALSCIIEVENEKLNERNIERSQNRAGYSLQNIDADERLAVQSGLSEFQDRTDEFNLVNRIMPQAGVKHLELSPQESRQRHAFEQKCSLDSQDCKPVTGTEKDSQIRFVSLSFDDNPFGFLNTSVSVDNRGTRQMLTSTPVVSGQTTTQTNAGCMVQAFFVPNQSVEQSHILERSGNARLAPQSSPSLPACGSIVHMRSDAEAKNDVMVDNGKHTGCKLDPDSLEDRRGINDLINVGRNSTSGGAQTEVLADIDSTPRSVVQSNLLPTFNADDTLWSPRHDGQKHQPSTDGVRASHPLSCRHTFVIAQRTANNDSALLEQVSGGKTEMKTCDQINDLSKSDFKSSVKWSENGNSKLQNDYEITSCTHTSEFQERGNFRPQVTGGSEMPNILKTQISEQSGRQQKAGQLLLSDDCLHRAENLPDVLLVKPRPKPLLPTPPYRRSAPCVGIPPCPHCVNHMPPAAPLLPRCTQGCGCAHGDPCLQTPFAQTFHVGRKSPVIYDCWGRAYNGPAATCLHHRGSTQTSWPLGPDSRPRDSKNRAPQSSLREKPTTHIDSKRRLQSEMPVSQEKLLQESKSLNDAHYQQVPASFAVTACKPEADGSPSLGERNGKIHLEPQNEVFPLLMLTWTFIVWSLTIAVQEIETHSSDDHR